MQNNTQSSALERIEEYLTSLKKTLDLLKREELLSFLDALLCAREKRQRIFIMGNGGSAATASHFVCDFNKGLRCAGKKPFQFICLNDNIPSIMAYANDMSYCDIFAEQLKNHMNSGDLVIGISGSGNSMNVVNAFEYANAHGGLTFALVGYNGGKLKQMAGKYVHVDFNDMQIVEDVHMIVDHMSMRVLCENLES